jgi:2-amino-4-hydroxy-6-hydroxymethyldihydropteridine diphosphokinase
MTTRTAFVAFGSNLGDRRRTVERALRALGGADGVALSAVSGLYETAPVGGPAGQRAYLNGVAEVRTSLAPPALLRLLRRIERANGRRRRVKWGPRTLDLDLLVHGRARVRSARLTLPHPRYHERRFVLAPFCDVAPGFVHPRLRRTNAALLRGLPGGRTAGERVKMVGTWTKSRFRPFSKRKKPAPLSSR